MDARLALADAAARYITEALYIYERQSSIDSSVRDLFQVARAIDSAHLGVDKLLKYVVTGTDEFLLVQGLSHEVLKTLHKALLHQNVTSIFETSARFNTLDAVPLANLISEVTHPQVAGSAYDSFVTALQSIVTLRNHVQHGLLTGESERLLSNVKRLLSEVFPIVENLCPEFFPILNTVDGQALPRLKALQQEIDAAWGVLLHHLETEQSVEIPITIYLTLEREGAPIKAIFTGHGSEAAISAEITIPSEDARGLFSMMITESEAKSRRFARMIGAMPQKSPRVGNETPVAQGRRSGLLATLQSYSLPKPEKLEPLNDGEVTIRAASASAMFYLGKTRQRNLSVKLLLEHWHLQLLANQTTGSINGMVAPVVPIGASASVPKSLEVTGSVWLTGEYVLVEDDIEFGAMAGSVFRTIRGSLRVQG